MLALIDALDDHTLLGSFDPGTLMRARTYAVEGRVRGVDVVAGDGTHELVLAAEVDGTGHVPYEVDVSVVHARGTYDVVGDCSCPVGMNCKHAAAVVLTLRERPRAVAPRPPSWGARLGRVLDDLDPRRPEVVATPLALEVDLQLPRLAGPHRLGARPVLHLRPLRRGARGRWVKTGASWGEVHTFTWSESHPPEQVTALQDLRALTAAASPYVATQSATRLDDFGAGLWPALRRALDAGVVLVPAGALTGVQVLEEPLHVEADLVRADPEDPAQGSRLEVGVRHDGRWWSGDDLLVLGQRGFGVALLTRDPTGRDPDARSALVAPLERGVPEPVRRLMTAEEPLVVPASDVATFTADYLPRLRRHVPVGSSDASVALPEEQPPALVLTVTWDGPTRVALSWGWHYRLGGAPHPFALDSPDGLRTVRQPALERAHLARLDLDQHATALLGDGQGGLVARLDVPTDRVLLFAGHVLPALQAHPLVEVVETGVRPAYRAAQGEPEIRFEAVEPGEADTPVDWLDLSVVVRVDGEQVPLPVVLEALTLGHDRIFLPSGLHLPADHPALARLAEAVRAARELVEADPAAPAEGDDDRLRVARDDLGAWGELADLGEVDARAAQWVRHAHALRDLTDLPDVDPVGVVTDLRGYQREGFRWLAMLRRAGLGGILADDMGLGKTLQALCLISHARAEGAGPFLVVAPTSVVSGWRSEAARHAPGLVVRTVTASGRKRGTSLAEEVEDADVVVTSYTLLRLDAPDYAEVAWGGLVLDEAQQVKNHRAQTHQAVRRVEAPFRLAITGTPFENRLSELWSLLSIVAPGLYPQLAAFTRQVAGPVERQGDAAALARFQRRIRPFVLRRTKDLVAADLPPKQEQVLEVSLGTRHRKVYDTHLQRERQTVLGLVDDFERNRMAIFRSLTRLRQLSLDAALLDEQYDGLGSAKLDVLVEHLAELATEGHRALVFSQFTSFLRRVRDRLDAEGIESAYLDGSTTDRGAVIDGFKEGRAPVFLISLKAGGVGLTLTEADYVFVLDPWWNPAVEAQAVDRAHRIGQRRPVLVYRLVATDTIEEKVMELKERKAALFAQVLDGDGALAQAVTADDVRALFDH